MEFSEFETLTGYIAIAEEQICVDIEGTAQSQKIDIIGQHDIIVRRGLIKVSASQCDYGVATNETINEKRQSARAA